MDLAVKKFILGRDCESPERSGDESRDTEEPELVGSGHSTTEEDADSVDVPSTMHAKPQMKAEEPGDAEEVSRLQGALVEMSPLLSLGHESLTRATQMIIERGWSNITWNRKYTALHLAAELGERDVVPLLVALRADPNQTDYKSRTAADIARKHSQLTTLEILQSYEAGEDCYEDSPTTKTASAWLAKGLAAAQARAAKESNPDVVEEEETLAEKKHRLEKAVVEASQFLTLEPRLKQLISTVASAGWRETPTDTTALHCAALLGCEDCLRLLVTLTGDVDIKDARGLTPMDVAIAGSQWSCVAKLRDLQREGCKDLSGEAPKAVAPKDGQVECVRLRFRAKERDQQKPATKTWHSMNKQRAAADTGFLDYTSTDFADAGVLQQQIDMYASYCMDPNYGVHDQNVMMNFGHDGLEDPALPSYGLRDALHYSMHAGHHSSRFQGVPYEGQQWEYDPPAARNFNKAPGSREAQVY
mmetsp:Transcript_15149/g.34495  ORF Transcript_15149/g.34495 Transcript_15149/m.34495 type:complete len:474 (-) Transcript_15149:29-1450(-)